MPATKCNLCGSDELITDYTAGHVACGICGNIVDHNLLVSEVGFAEGSGGRMHVQGAFVAHGSTGISGLRGRMGGNSSAKVKDEGHKAIESLMKSMGFDRQLASQATNSFNLAVDHRFNKGRRREYVIAACIYLQCRLLGKPYMLIDFSENLEVNVFELANTYLKLRSVLHLDKTTPEYDPAIYCVHFTRQLDFGHDGKQVAEDAARIVRRFKADWMTQGRHPSGVCGASLIIAARMSNYLRTVEEVAQVVKCSTTTIRRRLKEFAETAMAKKTVKEWRTLTADEIEEVGDEEPPIIKQQRLQRERAERARVDAERIAQEEREQAAADAAEDATAAGQGDIDRDAASPSAEKRGSDDGEDEDRQGLSKKRKANKGKGKEKADAVLKDKVKGKGKATARSAASKKLQGTSVPDFRRVDEDEAIAQALAAEGLELNDLEMYNDLPGTGRAGHSGWDLSDGGVFDMDDAAANKGVGGEEEDEDEEYLDDAPLDQIADALDMASDNPQAARAARMQERSAWKRANKSAASADPVAAADVGGLASAAGNGDGMDIDVTDTTGASTDGAGKSLGGAPGPQGLMPPAATQLRSIYSQDPSDPLPPLPVPVSQLGPDLSGYTVPNPSGTFSSWSDATATFEHFFATHFANDPDLSGLSEAHARDRVEKWMANGRDPQVVAGELWRVELARKRAEREQRMCREKDIQGVDEDELDRIIGMQEGEKQLRAETWLAKHSRWMEAAKQKEEERQRYIREHGEDPRAKKRKRAAPTVPGSRPYANAKDAVGGFMAQVVKPSQRVNMKGFQNSLASLGLSAADMEMYGGMGGSFGGGATGSGGGYGHGGMGDDEGLEGLVAMEDKDDGKWDDNDEYGDDDY